MRQAMEPTYMNSTCLLELVRVSAPEHYTSHPLWQHFELHRNTTCQEVTGLSTEEFFLQNHSGGILEFQIFMGSMFLYAAYSLVQFVSHLWRGEAGSFSSLIATVMLSVNHFSLFLLLSHYQHDCTHICGNVMHHSSYQVDGSNASLIGTLPPGLLFNAIVNHFMMFCMFNVAMGWFKLDTTLYNLIVTPVALARLLFNMMVVHPWIHAHGRSYYKEVFGAWFPFDEYVGHVQVHHGNGLCLGDTPIYSWFYDLVLKFHGSLYEAGVLRYQHVEHYVSNFVIDYFLLASIFMFVVLTVMVFYPFMDKVVEGNTAAVKAKKSKSA
jgi:hypothetical protein